MCRLPRPRRRHRWTSTLLEMNTLATFLLAMTAIVSASCLSCPLRDGSLGRLQFEGLDLSGLHVVGGTLQNAAGQVVQLHGVNRSSWEYTCFDGSGQTHEGPADQSEV